MSSPSADSIKEGEKEKGIVGGGRGEGGLNVHLIRIRHMAYGAESVTGPAMTHLRGMERQHSDTMTS